MAPGPGKTGKGPVGPLSSATAGPPRTGRPPASPRASPGPGEAAACPRGPALRGARRATADCPGRLRRVAGRGSRESWPYSGPLVRVPVRVTVSGGSLLFLFRLLHHERLGGEQHAGDRGGVLHGRPGHLDRVD